MNIKRKKSRSFDTLQQVIACLRVLVTFLIIVLINIVQKKNPILVLYQAQRRHVLPSVLWKPGIVVHFLHIKSVKIWGYSSNRPVYMEHRWWGTRQKHKKPIQRMPTAFCLCCLGNISQNITSVYPRSLSNFNDWRPSSPFYPSSIVQLLM